MASLSVREPPEPRLPRNGEATAFGATYRQDQDAWVIYWMPQAIPLGVIVPGFKNRPTVEFVLAKLNQATNQEPPSV